MRGKVINEICVFNMSGCNHFTVNEAAFVSTLWAQGPQ